MEYILIIGIILIAVVPIVIEVKRHTFDPFNIKNAFILYYVIQLCLSGLIALYANRVSPISLDPIYYREFYIKALLASFLGLLAFQNGYYFTNKRAISIPTLIRSNGVNLNFKPVIVFYFITGFISGILFLKSNDGFDNFVQNIETFRAEGVSGQGILLIPITQLLTIAATINLIHVLKNKKETNRIRLTTSLILILLASIPSLFLGFRTLLILPYLSYLVIFNYGYIKLSLKKIIPLSLVIIMAFTLFGLIREVPKGVNLNYDQIYNTVKANPELLYSVISRSKGIEVVATTIKKIEETADYDFGYKGIIETLTILVPRTIWPNKPIPGTVRFTTYFFGEDLDFTRGVKKDNWGGVSPTIIGESFWYFGWFGVVIIPFIIGVVYKKIYVTFLKNINSFGVLLFYSLLFPLLSMFPESLQGYSNSIFINCFLISITMFLLKLKVS